MDENNTKLIICQTEDGKSKKKIILHKYYSPFFDGQSFFSVR